MVVNWNTTVVVSAVLLSMCCLAAVSCLEPGIGVDAVASVVAENHNQYNGKHSFVNNINADAAKKTTLTIGYLTAIKGELKDKQGLAISGALTMALEEINNDVNILPNVTLALRWSDTKGDTVVATRVMTEMICDGVATFFGPEGPCHVEAIVSQSRNIPMIAYVSICQCILSICQQNSESNPLKKWIF
jgi:Receptor family ligand binding region